MTSRREPQYIAGMHAIRPLLALAAAALVAGCATAPPPAPEPAADPGMLKVKGGRFTMGRDQGELNERPAHRVDLDTYAVDRTEVSAAEFAEFLGAEGNPGERYFTPDQYATIVTAPGATPGSVSFAPRPGLERYPANNVSWAGADAYCRWRGRRLPTEAEWEKAARGTDKRVYPWGKAAPTASRAQFGQTWSEGSFDALVPVDALAEGASPYGLLNMAGNVLEWVSDWYRQNLCDFCNDERERDTWLVRELSGREPCGGEGQPPCPGQAPGTGEPTEEELARLRQAPPRTNPAGPQEGAFKVLRGGSWRDSRDPELAATYRFWLDPSQRFAHTGFRCAKDAERGEQPDKQPPAR